MSLAVPHQWESEIEQIAQEQHITMSEALDRIIQAGLQRLISSPEQPVVSNAGLFGSVNGPGAHGSKEAIDRYLAELRSEW